MKSRKVPMRTCALTREKLTKQELFRVVRTPDGEVAVDPTYKANGRGVYLKKDKNIISDAKLKRRLNHHLKVDVEPSIYEELISLLE